MGCRGSPVRIWPPRPSATSPIPGAPPYSAGAAQPFPSSQVVVRLFSRLPGTGVAREPILLRTRPGPARLRMDEELTLPLPTPVSSKPRRDIRSASRAFRPSRNFGNRISPAMPAQSAPTISSHSVRRNSAGAPHAVSSAVSTIPALGCNTLRAGALVRGSKALTPASFSGRAFTRPTDTASRTSLAPGPKANPSTPTFSPPRDPPNRVRSFRAVAGVAGG